MTALPCTTVPLPLIACACAPLGGLLTGGYMSAQGFYRFAAADTASEAYRPKAISGVMAGGLLSAVLGPQLVKVTAQAMVVPFLGTYLAVIALNLLGMFLFAALNIPKPRPRVAGEVQGRSRMELIRTPAIAVAVICATVSYALMNLVMTSSPLAVVGCGFETGDAANVVTAHVLAMYAPSFFTGHIIARLGAEKVVALGLTILAAAGAVAIHNAATVWNKALLDNAARPSGAMVYAPGDGSVLSPEQFERVRREMEAAFSGAANAGRPMLLEGGLDWRAMSLSPAEMDFVGLKAAAAREIALAFGVPPMLMGLPGDNSYANYREANKALWRQTILPLVGKIGAGLAQGLQGWWPGLSLAPDLDAVPALSDERAALWERVAGADFLACRAEAGRYRGLPLARFAAHLGKLASPE